MSFNTVGGFGPQLLFLNRLDMYIGCSCHVCLCMTCALSCLFYAKLQTFLHSRKICKQKLCLLTFERRVVGCCCSSTWSKNTGGRASGGRGPRGKPRGTVAMREEAGLGRERTREDEGGWERMGEDGRGWKRMEEEGRGWKRMGEDGTSNLSTSLFKAIIRKQSHFPLKRCIAPLSISISFR